jgi:hypothetical protein
MVTVGSGEPMTAGQTVSPLSGFTTLSDAGSGDVSAWAFAFAGPNTLYVATDQTGTGVPANGIQKWTLSGTTWSLQTTFNLATGQAIAGPVGFTGLTILATSAASTTFLATSETASPNFIVAFVDNGVYGSGGVTDTGTVIVQAPSGDMYEGLALTPH